MIGPTSSRIGYVDVDAHDGNVLADIQKAEEMMAYGEAFKPFLSTRSLIFVLDDEFMLAWSEMDYLYAVLNVG